MIACQNCSKVVSSKNSLTNHKSRCKGRPGVGANKFSRVKKDGPNVGRSGGSPTNNLKEALFLEMLEDSSDSPSFME